MTKRRASSALLIWALGPGCSSDRDVLGTYSGASFLTVDALPRPGTTGTRGTPTVCPGSIQIDRNDDGRLRGRFTRAGCVPSLFPPDEVAGEVTGTLMPDGTAVLTFSQAPVRASQAIRTSCGCPDAPQAGGPYVGRISGSQLTLRAEFRLDCCGLPRPPLGLPAFDVHYQIAAAR